MKGLLLKDFYTLIKYCRAFMLIIGVFIVLSCFANDNFFFAVYPILLAGMMPLTLTSYDEREKWNIYCETLPYTRAQIVSSKYLIGLLCELAIFVLSAVATAYRMISTGVFNFEEYIPFSICTFAIALIIPSITLPFIFRFGSEKGRIAYYFILGSLCAGGTILSKTNFSLADDLSSAMIIFFITIAAVAIYICSWGLSIMFYKKRTL